VQTEALAMENVMLSAAPLVISVVKRLASEVVPIEPVERMVAAGKRSRHTAGCSKPSTLQVLFSL
jgi:hypothetical protein